MEIEIKGKISADPRDRVLAIEAVTKAICQQTGQDPAEGVMMLLTAAVHLSNTYSRLPISQTATVMAESLGYAIVAADDFFKLRPVAEPARAPQMNSVASGDTIMKADVEKMIRDWQAECADHPAIHNQGNVLLGRLKALKPSLAMEDFLTGMDRLAEQAQASMTFSSDDDALEFLNRYGHGESQNGVIRGDWRCFDADCRAAVNYLCDEWDFVFEDTGTPPPQPNVGGDCPHCEGTGDASEKGRIEECCACEGTGKAPSDVYAILKRYRDLERFSWDYASQMARDIAALTRAPVSRERVSDTPSAALEASHE